MGFKKGGQPGLSSPPPHHCCSLVNQSQSEGGRRAITKFSSPLISMDQPLCTCVGGVCVCVACCVYYMLYGVRVCVYVYTIYMSVCVCVAIGIFEIPHIELCLSFSHCRSMTPLQNGQFLTCHSSVNGREDGMPRKTSVSVDHL